MSAGATTRTGRQQWHQVVESLRVRDFRRWFLSQVVSTSGTMTQGVALAWLVFKLSKSGVDLGALTAATMLPILVCSPLSGAVVDRLDKRRVLIVTQAVFLFLAVTLGVLTSTGVVRLWMVFAIAFAFGVVTAVDNPTRQVYVLDLVGSARTANAISLNEVVLNVSRVLGPAVGGVLLATVGVSTCFYVNAASFAVPIAVLVVSGRQATAVSRRDVRRLRLTDGVAHAWRDGVIRYGILMAAASAMLFNLGVALPLLATRTFHVGGGGYGAMMVAFGVGAIVGALLAAAGAGHPSWRRVRVLALATGTTVLAAAAMPDFAAELAVLVLAGLVSIWFISLANTVVQLRARRELRSQTMGLWVMALPGTSVLTGPVTGWVGETFGAREAFGLAGIALVMTALAAWRTYGAEDESWSKARLVFPS